VRVNGDGRHTVTELTDTSRVVPQDRHMILHMSAAIGAGDTELAAFDDALLKVGAANYNLVRLSSVIPPGTTVAEIDGAMPSPGGTWGDRLYVVYAEQRAASPGDEVWAGVGWVQDESGRGLFVEHEGPSESGVRSDLAASLEQLQRGRGIHFGTMRQRVIGATVTDRPLCALVLCAYATEPWAAREAELRAAADRAEADQRAAAERADAHPAAIVRCGRAVA
jgi:arginine decarboxylase